VNVTFEEKDALNALLTIELNPADYNPRIDSELKKYRGQAVIPGFRKGQAPMGVVKKMVGKSLLVEEVNKLAGEALYNYLKENNIDILGQPLASLEKSPIVDFDNPTDFTFFFDLGLAPNFELNFSEKDEVIRYKINLEESDVDEEIENNKRRYGTMTTVEQSGDDKDSLKGILTELDTKGQPFEGGVADKESTVLLEMIQDSATKSSLMGKKVGDVVVVNVKKFFNDNEKVMASTLGIPAEGLSDLNSEFSLSIQEINRFAAAELDEQLFEKMFGPGVVADADDFRTKIKANMESYYASEAENQVDHTISHVITDKHSFTLPNDFLKRWLINNHPDVYNEGNVEELYAKESNQLKNQLITEKVIEKFSLEVTEEDLTQISLGYTANMLRQYGMPNADLETIKYFETKNKEDKNYMRKIRDIAIDRKVVEQVKSMITLTSTEISIKDFYKKIEDHNQEHNHH
jgi:trigger factor